MNTGLKNLVLKGDKSIFHSLDFVLISKSVLNCPCCGEKLLKKTISLSKKI